MRNYKLRAVLVASRSLLLKTPLSTLVHVRRLKDNDVLF